MGRPPVPFDDEKFELLKGMICAYSTQEEIANMLKMSVDTLDRNVKKRGTTFAELFAEKRAVTNTKVRKAMLEKAVSGDTSMLIWWSKNHLGMTDKQEVAQTLHGNVVVAVYQLPDNGRG